MFVTTAHGKVVLHVEEDCGVSSAGFECMFMSMESGLIMLWMATAFIATELAGMVQKVWSACEV